MESQEVLESVRVSDNTHNSDNLCGDGLDQLGNGVKEGENNLGVNLLLDLDSYWEDINDRLIISRMVNDSVIKGMVNAVEQEAAEKIAAKELEMASLKDFSHVDVGMDRIESSGLPVIHQEPESINYGGYLSLADICVEHHKMRESLGSLRNAATEQFKSLKQQAVGTRGCSSMRRISSSSELVGLGNILREKETDRWVCVDRTVGSLEMTVNAICTMVDDVLRLSTSSLHEWQQDQDFRRELEALVIQSSIRSLQEEFEERLSDQNGRPCGSRSVNWLEKVDEISCLRKELDGILKSVPNSETGQLISHGSYDMDHSLHKTLSSHIPFSPSLWERNGKDDESKIGVPDTSNANQFKQMSNKDLVKYFNTTMTEMKRDHESTVQRMTEEYFSLRGKYLNERPLRKDKEFDILRKRITEVLMKLDHILVENEKFPAFSNNADSLGSLKNRLDSLLLENRQLRDSLTDKKNEVKCLSSQVSDADKKVLQHSSAEANMLELVANLNSSMEDASTEASVREEVYKCVLGELSGQIKSNTEESEIEFTVMQEIYKVIFGKAAQNTETTSQCEVEDSDMELLIMQGMCGIIFRETIKDAEGQLKELYKKYFIEKESRVSLEMEVLEKEYERRLEVEEKERLKQEVLLLVMSTDEKEELTLKVSAELMKEKEQLELASQELNKLRDHTNWQKKLISESSKELNIVNGKLVEALGQIEVDKMEINSLNQKFELAMKELKEAVIMLVNHLSENLANFECRVAEDIKNYNLRLEHSNSQLSTLIKKVNTLTRTGFLYKQRLERRCSDLQMAEAEVDLLGDEVEALLSLLEKLYIALDHYSPILQHYPGITEILKMVKRELSEESTKRF